MKSIASIQKGNFMWTVIRWHIKLVHISLWTPFHVANLAVDDDIELVLHYPREGIAAVNWDIG